MTKVFQIIIVAIALTSTAYSQQVRSSYFSVEQFVNNSGNIIRAYTPNNMLVVCSYSTEDQITRFTFLKKNSNTVKYVELPLNYRVNDFVILDNYMYFCGKNTQSNKCYIGMSEISASMQGIAGINTIVIDSAATLTKLVAYNGATASAIGIVAIGTPKNTAYSACVVDLNNYRENDQSWKYWYGHVAGEEITDICDASADLLATVGKLKTVSSGSGFVVAESSDLYLRTYKKNNVLAAGMSGLLHKYSNALYPYNGERFLVDKADTYNIAIVGTSKVGRVVTSNLITISKININTFVLNNFQRIAYDSTYSRNLLELEYFPATNKLGILANKSNIGELYFADMAKTSAYTSSRLNRADNRFNSITESNSGNFEILCSPMNIMSNSFWVLYENMSIFKESNCSTDLNIHVSAQSLSAISTTQTKTFLTYNESVSWSYRPVEIYETIVDIHCANYYK